MTAQSVKSSPLLWRCALSHICMPFNIPIPERIEFFISPKKRGLIGTSSVFTYFTMTKTKTVCYVGLANVHTGKKRC